MFTLPVFRPLGKDYDDDAQIMPAFDVLVEVVEYRHPNQVTFRSPDGREHRTHTSSIILLTGN